MSTDSLRESTPRGIGHLEVLRTGAEADPLSSLAQASSPAAGASAAPHRDEGNFLSFYGLRENPFADSVNPAFYYRTDAHGDAYQRMMLTIENDISLGMVTGLSGTGKTLLTQLILQNLDATRYQAILVLVSPGLSKTGLLREILAELNVALPAGINRTQELLKLLSNYIIDLHHRGQRLVIIIDECHFLSSDNLHIIRTISNIELPDRKLATCLLFGESRFAGRLRHPNYDSLRNRMYMRCDLKPMNAADCAQYVKFRLMAAGGHDELFDDAALDLLHKHSKGIGRSVNKLAMLSLLEGHTLRATVIGQDLVARCAATC
jgi:general secretion pathway protein A